MKTDEQTDITMSEDDLDATSFAETALKLGGKSDEEARRWRRCDDRVGGSGWAPAKLKFASSTQRPSLGDRGPITGSDPLLAPTCSLPAALRRYLVLDPKMASRRRR